MGNMQALDNGNVMIGWGSEPYFTEFGPNGEIVLDAQLPDGGMNYRAFRLPWHGRPSLPPTAVYRFAHGRGHGLRVVERRDRRRGVAARLRAARRRAACRHAPSRARGSRPRSARRPATSTARAVALDASGHVLGRSKAVRV